MTEGAREQGREVGGMSRRAAAWLAWSMWALALPLNAFSGVLGVLSALTGPWNTTIPLFLLVPLLCILLVTVGAFVASRRPENPIG